MRSESGISSALWCVLKGRAAALRRWCGALVFDFEVVPAVEELADGAEDGGALDEDLRERRGASSGWASPSASLGAWPVFMKRST